MLLCRDLILPGTENFSHGAEVLDLLLKLKRDPKGEILLVLFEAGYIRIRSVSIDFNRLCS